MHNEPIFFEEAAEEAVQIIGVIGAIEDQEIAQMIEKLDNAVASVHAGITFFEGELHGKPIVLCKSGVREGECRGMYTIAH